MKKNRQKYFGLRKKFILGIVLLSVCITIAIIWYSTYTYRLICGVLYANKAHQVSEAAAGYFDDEELEKLARLTYRYNIEGAGQEKIAELAESPRYRELEEEIGNLRQAMDAMAVIVCVIDVDLLEKYDPDMEETEEWNPVYYIMGSQDQEGEIALGGHGSIPAHCVGYFEEAVRSGAQSQDVYVDSDYFTDSIIALYPVELGEGMVVCVYTEMLLADIEVYIVSYVVVAVLLAVVIVIPLLIIGTFILMRILIKPIVMVANEAGNFVQNDNVISEKLGKIKTKDEIQILSQTLLKMEVDINDYIDNLTKVTTEKERISTELNVATRIQADMLPSIFPAFPDRPEFDIYATMTPAKEVGGDFYDFFLIDEDHLAIVMADVSGKGVPAALFMVIAKTLIKNRSQMANANDEPYSPAEILAYVNEQLCEGNEVGLFVTVWLCILQISTGKGIASNAGHEYPVICQAGGSYELIKTKNSPAVATMEGMRFREYEFELGPGDSLFVYTDGVTEATDGNNELFGTDRMLSALNENSAFLAEELLYRMKERIDVFVGDAPQFDDITMLWLKYYGRERDA